MIRDKRLDRHLYICPTSISITQALDTQLALLKYASGCDRDKVSTVSTQLLDTYMQNKDWDNKDMKMLCGVAKAHDKLMHLRKDGGKDGGKAGGTKDGSGLSLQRLKTMANAAVGAVLGSEPQGYSEPNIQHNKRWSIVSDGSTKIGGASQPSHCSTSQLSTNRSAPTMCLHARRLPCVPSYARMLRIHTLAPRARVPVQEYARVCLHANSQTPFSDLAMIGCNNMQ